MKKRLSTLESLRAFACIAVFTYHSYITLLGAWAVSVFVMLSGFLLAYNWSGRTEGLPSSLSGCIRYAFKKVGKMYPLYFFTLLILILRIVILAPDDPPKEQLIVFAKQFVYCSLLIQSWLPNTDWAFALNGVGWYLSTMLILYFAFPWIMRAIEKLKTSKQAFVAIALLYAAMTAVALAARFLYERFSGLDASASVNFQHWFSYVFPPYRLFDFAIACILGHLFRIGSGEGTHTHRGFRMGNGEGLGRAAATGLELTAILLAFLSNRVFNHSLLPNVISYNVLFVPSSALLVYSFALGKGLASRALDCRPIHLISDYSVEIFLLHFAVIKYASPFATVLPIPYLMQQVVFISFTVAVTVVSVIIWRRLGKKFPVLAVR